MVIRVLVICFIAEFCFLSEQTMFSPCPQEPLCNCNPISGMFDVYCSNITNLESVVKLLRGVFHNSTINRLMLMGNCRLTTLPDHAFENITILVLYTSCPFFDIPQNSFRGTKGLSIIDLQNTTFRTIPSGLLNLEQLQTFNLKYSRLTALNRELWNLTSLSFITFSNGNLQELAEDVFFRTPNIIHLDLSYNFLTYLNPDTLKPLNSLQRIYLQGNQITTADGLFKHLNPEVIDLYGNNVTSLDNVFHKGMWRLKTLNIGKNPIKYLNSSSIRMFWNLEVFDMVVTKCSQIDPKLFSFAPRLKEAILRLNKFQSIPLTLFHNLKKLEILDLSSNYITSIQGIFQNNKHLTKLMLSYNSISKLEHSFQNLTKLEILYIRRNKIEGIYNNDFDGLVNLKHLSLAENKIITIEMRSFSRLQKLSTLGLAGNKFPELNRTLRNLVSLEILSLSSVNLKEVHRDEFVGLTRLSIVNLVNNKIKSLNGAFRDVKNLIDLNIAKNKLVTLSRSTFPEEIKLEILRLSRGNRIRCDCRLSWMITWLSEKNYTVLKDDPLCHLPPHLRGKPIKELTIKDVTVWPDDCPDYCQCECVDQDTKFYVHVNCSYRNLTYIPYRLPQELGVLDLSDNELKSVSLSNYNFTYGLVNLNLERNKLRTLSADILSYVKELKLAGNFLNRLSLSTRFNVTLELLTLANNPWICDCSAVDFRKWLLSYGDIVTDINQTKCGYVGPYPKVYGRVITSLRDTDLCPPVSVINFYFSLTIGFLCLLLLATSLWLVYSKYHLFVKMWLYSHGFAWVKDDEEDTEKKFDALVSYHSSDEEFVFAQIVFHLEKQVPRFKLCVPERDFICGEFSNVLEMKTIEDSRRTIVVLTRDYIDNAFCMSIFQLAFQVYLEKKIHGLILIRKDNICETEDMSPELKIVLNSNNCIDYEKPMFWEKVRFAMPKRITRNIPRNKRTDTTEFRPTAEHMKLNDDDAGVTFFL